MGSFGGLHAEGPAWVTAQETSDHALRLALTGEDHGPELADVLLMMARPRTAERLQAAAI